MRKHKKILSILFIIFIFSVANAQSDSLINNNSFRKHEIGIQYNPVFYNNRNTFKKGFHHNIYSLKYGYTFKEWIILGMEINYISKKSSFSNYPMKWYIIIPELYAKFNLLSNKNKNCIFFIEANVGYFYLKGKLVLDNTNGSTYRKDIYISKPIYFITPGIRLYIFPYELDKRLSLDLMCKLSAKKDFLVNINYYCPSFKINYHFNKVKFNFNMKWVKNILD